MSNHCERCGHEGCPGDFLHAEQCIANLRADLARCNADASTIENHMRERLAGLEADLEAERARSWLGWERAVESEEDYEQLRPNYLEAEERAARAEAQCAAMRAALERVREMTVILPDDLNANPMEALQAVEGISTRALATDPGNLLTAVRRLCEVAGEVCAKLADGRFFVGSEERDLREALADPALAGLRGAP